MGRVRVTVCTHSSTGMPLAIMVAMILEVRVERIFALTPLPSPSASTRVSAVLEPHGLHPVAAEFLSLFDEAHIAHFRCEAVHRVHLPARFNDILQPGQGNLGLCCGLAQQRGDLL